MTERQNRVYFRLALKIPVSYCLHGSNEKSRGLSLDISAKGLGMLSQTPLEKDSECILEFGLPGVWKKIHSKVRVMNCFEKSDLPKPFRYRMGLEFQDLEEKTALTISRFILSKTSFFSERCQVLIAGLFVFFTLLGRGILYEGFGIFEATDFGKEWLWHMPWANFFSIMGIIQLMLALIWFAGCMGFYSFNRLSLWFVTGFSFVFAVIQAFRLVLKWPVFFSSGAFGAGLFCFESALGAVLALMVIVSFTARPKMEAYLRTIQEYAAHSQASA